jgi:hypothetical protein
MVHDTLMFISCKNAQLAVDKISPPLLNGGWGIGKAGDKDTLCGENKRKLILFLTRLWMVRTRKKTFSKNSAQTN